MSAAGRKFVWLGPEVGDQGDLAVVGEIEEAQAGLGAFWPGELDPAGCALAFADDSLHGEVPVVGEAFHVEPDIGVVSCLRVIRSPLTYVPPWLPRSMISKLPSGLRRSSA